jgi:transcriptional regulator of arginine metabolism
VENINSAGTARQRRDEIARLVRGGPVASQEALQQALRRRGIRVAQPTLSRDLRSLGLVKTPAGYAAPGAAGSPRGEPLDRVLRVFVLSVRPAGSVLVIRTPAAGAQPVARALDEAELPDVAGTIAGDDTVFVATPGPAAAGRLARRLSTVLRARRPEPRRARA